MGQWQYPRS